MKEVLLQNNNKKIIGKLSRRYLKASWGRNIIAILAIILTTMMFTSVFTIGSGFVKVQQEQTMRQVGTSGHGGFKYLTWEEYDKIKTHPSIKEYGTTIFMTRADNPEFSKLATELRWMDENAAKNGFSMPTVGKLPQLKTELATSTIVLNALGIPHEVGVKVPIEFVYEGKRYETSFTLSGFWEGDPVSMAQGIFLSRDYVDQIVSIDKENYFDREIKDVNGSLDMDVMFGNSFDIQSKLFKILEDSGYEKNQIEIGVNWAYMGSGEIDITTLAIVGIVLLLIGVAGYLIIYNVFYISVTKDIRNYGLLKTLGATPQQLRRLVRRQALLLSVAGIPTGILLGYGMGYLLLPMLLLYTTYQVMTIPIIFNVWIPLGATVFTFITIWLSCRKPCKVAATVSPIEALRTHESSGGRKKTRSSKRVSILPMAWHNVTRNKKRVFAVVASLTISLVLLNSVYGATKSFDIDKFMGLSIVTDFSIAEGKMLTQYQLTYMDTKIVDDFSNISGVVTTSATYMQEYLLPPEDRIIETIERFVSKEENMREDIKASTLDATKTRGLSVHLYGIDEFLYNKLEFYGNKPTWEEFINGNYILDSPLSGEKVETRVFKDNEKIILTDRNGMEQEYTILVAAKVPYPSTPLHGHSNDIQLILPQQNYLTNFMQDSLIYLHLKCDEEAIPKIEKTIEEYCETRTLTYNSRASYMAEFEGLKSTYMVVGGALSAILGLVGILNFMNSITTSIFTRRQELAMLQSVGMTQGQMRTMLIWEGIMYIALTALITLTLGNALSAILVNVIAGEMWFFTYYFSIVPMLICLPLLLVPAVLIPTIAYGSVNKQSVVERLRQD